MERKTIVCVAALLLVGSIYPTDALSSVETIGPNGINSAALGLTGDGIIIGQVEPFRPGKPGYDTDANCCNVNVNPVDVFVHGVQANPNQRYNEHALAVAGVMISTATEGPDGHSPPTGVSTEADLYSSAFTDSLQSNAAIASQHLATDLNARSINMSFGLPLQSGEQLNGSSLLTSFVDWSARTEDIYDLIPQRYAPLQEVTTRSVSFPPTSSQDTLTAILRSGAQRLLAEAVEAEVREWIESHAHVQDSAGRRQVVRNGYLPQRSILTGVGPVEVEQPRVLDRRGEGGEPFSSKILPPYLRKTRSLEELIPWLYLKGVSTGDFSEALSALAGPDAHGLSASTITRLKEVWEGEFQEWTRRQTNKESGWKL